MNPSRAVRVLTAVSGTLAAAVATVTLTAGAAAADTGCPIGGDRPCLRLSYTADPGSVIADIHYNDSDLDRQDHYNLRWTIDRSGAVQAFPQYTVAAVGDVRQGLPLGYPDRSATVTLSVQNCSDGGLGRDDCSPWQVDSITPVPMAYGADTCAAGYIWREAYGPDDHTCVAPAAHDQAAADNSAAAGRRVPDGAYGPDTCRTGYIWREARPSDHVCVAPPVHDQTVAENRDAGLHRA